MSVREILGALARFPPVHALAKANHLVTAAIQVVHISGFLLLLTALTLICLRVLGLVLTAHSVPQIARQSSVLLWVGTWMALLSGMLLFCTGPLHYYFNKAFDIKMLLLAAALLFQSTWMARVLRREGPPTGMAKVGAVLALFLWFGTAWSGRIIGFL